ncbi:HAD family phosphatase [Candidatus Sumerlaeota bacterium]|nr:HAD family phosphatase [Candidatus Sumerlaeota bacterium]
MKLPKAFIFDGDGVVFDTEELSILAFRRVARHYGAVYAREQCGKFIGCGTQVALGFIRDDFGIEIDPDDYVSRRDAMYETCCAEVAGPHAMRGVIDTLNWLDAKGIPYGMASSASPAKLQFNLEKTGLLPRFTVRVNGDEVRRGKPAPDIFEEAARRLMVAVKDCIVVEDSVNGLKGALTAGAGVIAIGGSHPMEELREYAQMVFESPVEMIDWMKRLF